MISTFLQLSHSEIEHLEQRDFLNFRNETVKLLSEIQYKAEELKRQVKTTQQVTTFQLPEATQARAGHEYILTILDTQPVSVPVVQPTQIATTQPATVIAKVQQPSRHSSTCLQLQLHHRRKLNTTLLDYPVSLELFQVYYSTSSSTHQSHFQPLNFNQHRYQCHLPLIMHRGLHQRQHSQHLI